MCPLGSRFSFLFDGSAHDANLFIEYDTINRPCLPVEQYAVRW